jgi:hypothetical protein
MNASEFKEDFKVGSTARGVLFFGMNCSIPIRKFFKTFPRGLNCPEFVAQQNL